MTARYPSPYIWQVDWDDDGYQHPLATIPSDDVVRWSLDAGGLDDDLAPTPTDGSLSLYHSDGRYQRTGTFTEEQLRSVHRWRVTASAVEQGRGRCYPAAGLPLLQTVEPALWLLEGESVPALLARRRWQINEGTLDAACAAISAQAGVTVSNMAGGVAVAVADVTAIDWTGTLTGLLGRLCRAIGAFAVQRPDGSILLVESAVALGRLAIGTLDAAGALIDATNTRVGQRSDLVRTELVVPVPSEDDPRRRLTYSDGGAVARYGRRTLVLELWGSVSDVLIAGSIWRTPWIELELALLDAARDLDPSEQTRLAVQCNYVRAGNVLTVVLPDGSGATTTYKALVVSLRLRGGGRTPERHARMIVLHSSDDVAVPALPGADAPPAPRLRVVGLMVFAYWSDNHIGNADVARVSPYQQAGAPDDCRV